MTDYGDYSAYDTGDAGGTVDDGSVDQADPSTGWTASEDEAYAPDGDGDADAADEDPTAVDDAATGSDQPTDSADGPAQPAADASEPAPAEPTVDAAPADAAAEPAPSDAGDPPPADDAAEPAPSEPDASQPAPSEPEAAPTEPDWTFPDSWQPLSSDGAGTLLVDTDGDGAADVQVRDNGDGTFTVAQDADRSGDFESALTVGADELELMLPGIGDVLGSTSEPDPSTGEPGDSAADPPPDDSTDPALGEPEPGEPEPGQPADGTVDWDFGDGGWVVVGAETNEVGFVDVDGDGVADLLVGIAGDGTFIVAQDADGDGSWESQTTMTVEELDAVLPGLAEALPAEIDAIVQAQIAADPGPDADANPVSPEAPEPLDLDGDGTVDAVRWHHDDGSWEVLRDADGDGVADSIVLHTPGQIDVLVVAEPNGQYTVYHPTEDGSGWDPAGQAYSSGELDTALPGVSGLLGSTVGPDGVVPAEAPLPVSFDADGDGTDDAVRFDHPDGSYSILYDLDGDGTADAMQYPNGDGTSMIVVPDGHGGYDRYQVDQDGQWAAEPDQHYTRAQLDDEQPGLGALLGSPIADIDTAQPEQPAADSPDGASDLPELTEPTGQVGFIDVDADGVDDTARWDFGDGTWQELWDTDADQQADQLVLDTDGDGQADYAVVDNGNGTYTVYASDGAGWSDSQTVDRAALDAALPGAGELLDGRVDEAGAAAEVVDPAGLITHDPATWSFDAGSWQVVGDAGPGSVDLDVDGDGTADLRIDRIGDSYAASQDMDGDGIWESQTAFDTRADLEAAIPGAAAAIDLTYEQNTDPDPWADPTDAATDTDIPAGGDPSDASDLSGDGEAVAHPSPPDGWFDDGGRAPAVPVGVAMIVADFGNPQDVTEEQFLQTAADLGLLDGHGGPNPEATLDLLESAGVPADLAIGDLDSLDSALADGRPVLVFVDGGELSGDEVREDSRADQAMLVTGIDFDAGVAYLVDPAHPDTVLTVPLDSLQNAWEDSGFQMIVCDQPVPEDTAGGAEAAGATVDAGAYVQTVTPAAGWVVIPAVVTNVSMSVWGG